MVKTVKAKKEAEVVDAKKVEEIFDIPALVVTPAKAPVVDGNFAQVEAVLLAWKNRVSGIEMTEKNMTQVEIVKKEAVALRNRIVKIGADTKRLYFNDPKAVFDKKVTHLLSVVADVEGIADEVLDVKEQRRRDGLNEVFDVYKDDFQTGYKLEPEYLARVEYKKEYYNKTAVEKDSKDDLEQQFTALKKEQDARAASLRLIKTMCKDEPRLNVQHWIDQLAFKDTATVTEEIAAEKERLAGFDRGEATGNDGGTGQSPDEEETTGGADAPGSPILGAMHGIDFSSDFPDRTKKRTLEMEYPCDVGDDIAELFRRLRSCGIKVKVIKEPKPEIEVEVVA
jgi:hypothetical protein